MDNNLLPDDQFITEYQLLMKYCSRRKTKSRRNPAMIPMSSAVQLNMRKCNSSSKMEGLLQAQCLGNTDEIGDVVESLAQTVTSAPLVQNEVETDSGEYVVQRLVELLKESGDELNEKIQKDHELLGYLQSSFSYSVFEKLASAFIGSSVPSKSQNQGIGQQKIQIAWTFEMTCRLTALDLQPMNRAMGFGAQYLHQNFAQWIQQHGGWEKVFNKAESGDE